MRTVFIFVLFVIFASSAAADEVSFRDRADFADGLFSRNLYDMAFGEYEAILKDAPEGPSPPASLENVYYRAAECLFFVQKLEPAILRYLDFVSRYPGEVRVEMAHARIGEALRLLKRYDEARFRLEPLWQARTPAVRGLALYTSAKMALERELRDQAKILFEKVLLENAPEYHAFAHFYLGEILMSRGKFSPATTPGVVATPGVTAGEALEHFQKAGKTKAREFKERARFGEGRALFALTRFEEAKKIFEELEGSAENTDLAEDAYLNVLHTLDGMKDPKALLEKAAIAPASAAQSVSKMTRIRFLTADAHAALREYKTAMGILDDILASAGLSPEDRARAEGRKELFGALGLEKEGRLDEGLGVLEKFLESKPESEVAREAMWNRAYMLIRASMLKDARGTLNEFLSRFPDDARSEKANFDIIVLDLKLGETAPAIHNSEAYLSRFGKSANAPRVKARLLYLEAQKREREGRYLDAFRLYTAMDFGNLEAGLQVLALKARAFCALKLGNNESAARDYERLMERSEPERLQPEVFFWLAEYYIGRSEPHAARRVIEQFAGRSDASLRKAEADFFLAESLRLEGKFEDAIHRYGTSVESGSAFRSAAIFGRGMCLEELGRADEAVRSYEEALKFAGDDSKLAMSSRMKLAGSLQKLGRGAEAAKTYMSVAILYEDSEAVPQALARAGAILKELGKSEEAQEILNELERRFPENNSSRRPPR